MKETHVGRWARTQVIKRLVGDLLHPVRAYADLTAIYRTGKQLTACLPKRSLVDLSPGIDQTEVRIQYWPQPGGTSMADMTALILLAKHTNRRSIFEFGTFRGYTTYNLALNTHPDSKIYTLDLPGSSIHEAKLELTSLDLIDKEMSGEQFLGSPVAGKIIQLYGDSAAFDYTPYEGEMDLVFVDASHSYGYVLSDSLVARRLISTGGIIIWHDYPTWPGVWLCLEELKQKWSGRFIWIEDTELVIWLS
jgi:predicted O-methyltransferase YrrM